MKGGDSLKDRWVVMRITCKAQDLTEEIRKAWMQFCSEDCKEGA
tara:strand:+ start:1572 stop:1703 length:132 start_codon:yes stop_codon:yes gene_type:complete